MNLESFVQDCEAALAKRPVMPVTGPVVRPGVLPGSLWVSKATHRRGRVSWASGGLVELVYSESQPNAKKVMAEADLIKNYTQIN